MKKNRLGFLALIGGLLASFLVSFSNVSADTVLQSMTVSPPNQRLILSPGETYEGVLKISNSNSSIRNLEYAVSIGSFSQARTETSKDDYGVVDHISVSNYNQIMDWITLDKDKGTVAPNETDVVVYTIKVPEDVPAGGQYATIIVSDETGKSGGEGNVAIESTYQFATVIFAEIAGKTREEGLIKSNSVPAISFSSPLSVSSMVKNNGNVHTDAEYTLEVWPLFSDEEVYTNVEKPDTSLVLPDTERYNVQTWDGAPMVGIFRVRQTVKIFDETSVVEKTVLICPLWLMVVVIVAIAAVIIWLIFRKKNRQNN